MSQKSMELREESQFIQEERYSRVELLILTCSLDGTLSEALEKEAWKKEAFSKKDFR